MMATLVIFLSLFLLVFAFSMSELVKAMHKQNELTEKHLEHARDMFIEVKGNRLNNEKTRILNEEYLELILAEKRTAYINQLSNQVTYETPAPAKVKSTKSTKVKND